MAASTLRDDRESLFRRICASSAIDPGDLPSELLQIQVELAATIRSAESRADSEQRGAAKTHIRLMRLAGDSLAWMLLHPHAIRQLEKNTGAPPSLSAQGNAFEIVLEDAKAFAQCGLLPLIADLTHQVRVGDVILCNDLEHPYIWESKSKAVRPEHVFQGRRGRQLVRILETTHYLKTGKLAPSSGGPTLVEQPAQVVVQYNWPAVQAAVRAGMKNGASFVDASSNQVLLCLRADAGNSPAATTANKQYADACSSFARPVQASHLDRLQNVHLPIAPPLAWPLPVDARIALMESDIVLWQAIDLSAFEGPAKDEPRIVRVELPASGQLGDFPIVVLANGKEHRAGWRFIVDALYGYATIPSIRDAIFETHHFAVANAESGGTQAEPLRREDVEIVSTPAQAKALVDDIEAEKKRPRAVLIDPNLFGTDGPEGDPTR